MHKHHIIPRHLGGTNDPSNLLEVTVEEHAEIHRRLYEEEGRWQDRIAWLTLSGQITKEEASILAVKMANTGNKYSLGRKASKETRLKQSLAKKGRKLSAEHRRKIGAGNTGRIQSEETRRKISNGLRGENNGMYGMTGDLNPARRSGVGAKISNALKGKKLSEEHKKKLSVAKLGKKFSLEHRKKLSEARRRNDTI